jgi:5'-phosphate synthase pdxT subunit
MSHTPTIGVLALQGAFEVHARRLASLGATTLLIRRPEQLATSEGNWKIDALVIPGGESTTFLKHLERSGFYDTLNTFVHTKPVFGTCAGCILLAKEVTNAHQSSVGVPAQQSFGVLDITIERNAYGRQNESAILTSETTLPGGPLEMVFIRAPRITRTGPDVETLATRDNTPTLIRQGRLLAATFHPELTDDTRVHQLFLNIVREATS